ncbi:hypothetical protein Osc1_14560 [Hominimerdicola sp. 21CYCFAH17_S]
MIKNLSCKNGIVSWNDIKLKIKNAFLATENKGIIQVKCGENYVEQEVQFYDEKGSMILKYNLITNTLLTTNRQIVLAEIEQVMPYNNKIVILCNKNKIIVLNGDEEQEIRPINGYIFNYLTFENGNLIVICNGDKNHMDKFGRLTRKFNLDDMNCCLIDKGIAY